MSAMTAIPAIRWPAPQATPPLPPGFDPIRPQPTPDDPMLRESAEGHNPKMEKPGLKPGAFVFANYQLLIANCSGVSPNEIRNYPTIISLRCNKKICNPLPDTDFPTCGYTHSVTFTWDARKAVANLKKHAVDFREAATVFYDPLSTTFPDDDHSEAEQRFLTIGRSARGNVLIVA